MFCYSTADHKINWSGLVGVVFELSITGYHIVFVSVEVTTVSYHLS